MQQTIETLKKSWSSENRWQGVQRPYSAEEVVRLRGSLQVEHTLARMGAEKLWNLLRMENFVAALGALTGNQALQQVQAGLKAVYCSGWQVAADTNEAGQMYGMDRLHDTIRRTVNLSADKISGEIRDELARFRGSSSQDDDVTFVIVKVE